VNRSPGSSASAGRIGRTPSTAAELADVLLIISIQDVLDDDQR
jgi:hypothetical protein